jgi:hypothetical protein
MLRWVLKAKLMAAILHQMSRLQLAPRFDQVLMRLWFSLPAQSLVGKAVNRDHNHIAAGKTAVPTNEGCGRSVPHSADCWTEIWKEFTVGVGTCRFTSVCNDP